MNAFIKRYLDPSESIAELLFGLIMTLTFTLGAGLVIEEGPDATRGLLIGVIGCNIAWGIIDGILYIFTAMYARGMPFRAKQLLSRNGPAAVGVKLDEGLDENYGNALSDATKAAVKAELLEHLVEFQPAPVKMTKDDLLGALASFILVVATAIPAVLPFLVIDDRMLALRVSNLLLVALLYLIGSQWASYVNANRRKIGMSMALGGLVIVQLTILLGG